MSNIGVILYCIMVVNSKSIYFIKFNSKGTLHLSLTELAPSDFSWKDCYEFRQNQRCQN